MGSIATDHKKYFLQKFGLTERLLERCLGEALSAGGDYADLYFESVAATSLGVDEQIVKSASQGVSAGCGVRVVAGERTGYAYTDDLSASRLLHAARTAALIASGPATHKVAGFKSPEIPDLYPVPAADVDVDLAPRLELVMRADRAARSFDPRIVQVRASLSEETRRILVVASDGTLASDIQSISSIPKKLRNTLPAKPRARPFCSSMPSPLLPERWKSFSAPGGQACSFTKP